MAHILILPTTVLSQTMPRQSTFQRNAVLKETLAAHNPIQQSQIYTLLEAEAILRVPRITIIKWIRKRYVNAYKESYTDYSNIPKKGGFRKIRKQRFVLSGTELQKLATALTNELELTVASELIVERVFGSSLRNSLKQVMAYSCMRLLERRNYFGIGMLGKRMVLRTEIETLSARLEKELRELAESKRIIKSADMLERTTFEQYSGAKDFSNSENIRLALHWLCKQAGKRLEELVTSDFTLRGLEPLLTFGQRIMNDQNASTAKCVQTLAAHCSLEFDSSRAKRKTTKPRQARGYTRAAVPRNQDKPLVLDAFLAQLDPKSRAKAERFDRITLERFRRAYSVLKFYNRNIANAFKKNILDENKILAENIISTIIELLDTGTEIAHAIARAETRPNMIEIGNRLNSIFGFNNNEQKHGFVLTLLRELDMVSCSALEACVKELYGTAEFENFLHVFAIIVKKELNKNTLLIAGAFAFCMHMGTEEQRKKLLEDLQTADKLPYSEISSRVCSCTAELVIAGLGETSRPLFREFAQDNHSMDKLASACIMTGKTDFERLCACVSRLLESGNWTRLDRRMTDNGESAFASERFGPLQAMLALFSASHRAICSEVVFTIAATINTLEKIFIAGETLSKREYRMKPNGNGVLVFERTSSKGKPNCIIAIEIKPNHILAYVESLIAEDKQPTRNRRRTAPGSLMNTLGQNMVNAIRNTNAYDSSASESFFNALGFQALLEEIAD